MISNLRRIAPLSVFSKDELEEIYFSTLEALRRTGVKVTLPEAVALLKKAGCWVDGDRVRIPSHLIEWAIRTAPHKVVLCDREGKPAMYAGGYESYFGTGSDCIFVIDPYTGQRREALLKDVADFAKVVDASPNMNFAMGMSVAHDVPDTVADLHQFKAMVTNTTKPLVYATWGPRNLKRIVEMCEVVAGGEEAFRRSPFALLFGCPISPLQHADDPTESLLYTAKKGLPYISAPTALAGGTAPVTLAAAMVQINGDMLSGLLLAQLQREGAPYILFAGCPQPMDMRTMIASYASPEFLLFQTGLTQLQHHLGLPTFGTAGCSDSKVFDQQAAIEGTMSMMVAALSGANLIHDVGYVEYGSTSCFEQVVTMDEVAGELRFLLNGIRIDKENLALDVIDDVGPGGQYVTHEHTLRHFREGFRPKIVGNRETFEVWSERGGKTLGDRAHARVLEILEKHVPKPLPEATIAALDKIISEATQAIGLHEPA